MTDKLLIMGCSRAKIRSDEPLPAYKLYDGPRWRIFRKVMPTLTNRPRVLVLSARFGIIRPMTLLPYYDHRWTSSNWRQDTTWVKPQYDEHLRPLLRPNLDIFVAAGAPYRSVLEACGIIDDVVTTRAIYRAPIVPMGVGLQKLREWLLGGQNNA